MYSNKIIKFANMHIPNPLKKMAKFFLNDIRNLKDWLLSPLLLIEELNRKTTWISKEEIDVYRKKIKIYDTFLFFNEMELLEIRLNILDPFVDYFVIVEATKTFTGLNKKLFFNENKELFKKWEHKIIHYIITDTPNGEEDLLNRLSKEKLCNLDKKIINDTLKSDNIPHYKDTQWLREFYQKESIKKALIGLSDNDFCFLSDLDEIWNPKIIIDYTRNNIYRFKQIPFIYFLDNRTNENWKGWTGTSATKYINIKNGCLNYIRTKQKISGTILCNGGWHFSFQGGVNKIKLKLESYGHQEINTFKVKSQIENNLILNKDIRGRHIKFWKDEKNLPKYILENKEKYKKMFRNE